MSISMLRSLPLRAGKSLLEYWLSGLIEKVFSDNSIEEFSARLPVFACTFDVLVDMVNGAKFCDLLSMVDDREVAEFLFPFDNFSDI